MKFLGSKELSLACCIINYALAIIYFANGDAMFFMISLAFGVLCHRNYLTSNE